MSLDLHLTSTLHQQITIMDSNNTTDDSGQNLMHQTNDEIRIRENAEVTQHDPDLENNYVGYDEEHIEASHWNILDVKLAMKNARISQRKNLLKGIDGNYQMITLF